MKMTGWFFYSLLLATVSLAFADEAKPTASQPQTKAEQATAETVLSGESGENASAATETKEMTAAAQRGEGLHKNKCMGCHIILANSDPAQLPYLIENRQIKSYQGLKNQVERCVNAFGFEWHEDKEIADIMTYLNEKYYQFETETSE